MFFVQADVLALRFCDQDDDDDGGEGMIKTITFAILTGMISEIMTMLLNWRNP